MKKMLPVLATSDPISDTLAPGLADKNHLSATSGVGTPSNRSRLANREEIALLPMVVESPTEVLNTPYFLAVVSLEREGP